MIRIALLALTSAAALLGAVFCAWTLIDDDGGFVELTRIPVADVDVARAGNCIIISKTIEWKGVPFERIEHADGSVTEIKRGPSYEQRTTIHPDGRRSASYAFGFSPQQGRWIGRLLKSKFGGYGRLSMGYEESRAGYELWFPVWMPTLAFATFPLIVLFRGPLRRRRRLRRGRCTSCGYDLTGNESGICPECGTETHVQADGCRPHDVPQ